MKIAYLFPGQGAQAVGMGLDLYNNSPAARAAFDTIDAACGSLVSKICFSGPDDALKATENTQPALFAVSVAAFAACQEAGLPAPSAVAGHSVGEYAALVAAGALTVEGGAKLVAARGLAMSRSADETEGTMAAVLGLEPDVIALVCAEVNHVGVVVVANLNAPGQTVISGETAAVEAVTPLLKARGAKRVLPLAVSGAFHSPLMATASGRMHNILQAAPVSDPAVPVVANVLADYVRTGAEVRAALAAQVAGPVRWVECIERLVEGGVTVFIECGPGNVLAGLNKRIAPDAVTYSVSDTATLQAARAALGANA